VTRSNRRSTGLDGFRQASPARFTRERSTMVTAAEQMTAATEVLDDAVVRDGLADQTERDSALGWES
jgi:hypothetical protein